MLLRALAVCGAGALLLVASSCGTTSDERVLPPVTPQPQGTTRSVAPSGSDDSPGTPARPWRTLRHALQQLRPGQTLVVGGGRYSERLGGETPIAVRPATRERPILVRVRRGERAVLEGLLWLKGASYWTLDGLEVSWRRDGAPDEHMVKLEGGTGWRLTRAVISGARSYAAVLVAGTPSSWRIDNSCIHDTYPANDRNQDHNLYVNTGLGADSGLIERNVVFGAPNGSNLKIGGTGAEGGSDDVTVRFNTFADAAQPILVGGETSDTLIEANIILAGRRGYLIRGYELDGDGNVARGNLGWGAGRFIENDAGSGEGVRDGGGNRLAAASPFEAMEACADFAQAADDAVAYGHLARRRG